MSVQTSMASDQDVQCAGLGAAGPPKVAPSEMQGGGDGLFADRAYAPGECVIEDQALVQLARNGPLLWNVYEALQAADWQQLVRRDEGRALYRGSPDRLGGHASSYREWAAAALESADASQREESLACMLAICFNAYITQPDGRSQAVFPRISKANHSCFPNAYVMAPDDGPGQLVCCRAISPGDEVTVSYLCSEALGSPVERRQDLLQESWEFVCGCMRCQAVADDTRAFSCPRSPCLGRCAVLRADTLSGGSAPRCSACGQPPPFGLLREWRASEDEVGRLLDELPEALYSAWATCEDFSAAHPAHWLSGRWKRHLSAHLLAEARDADTPEEAQDLRSEAEEHTRAATRCLEEALGMPAEVPCSPAAPAPMVAAA